MPTLGQDHRPPWWRRLLASLHRDATPYDLAPGWWVVCPQCGRRRKAGEVGMIRLYAASVGKRVRGHCSVCDAQQWLHVTRSPDEIRVGH